MTDADHGQRHKVLLIVEDELVMVRALSDRLLREGFDVLRAGTCPEGLATSLEKKPDCILLDILMPGMSGLDFLKKLRTESTFGKNVPVILLTNVDPSDDAVNEAVTNLFPSYYIVKSNSDLGEIVEKVHECLSSPLSTSREA